MVVDNPTLSIRLPNTRHRAAVATSVVRGLALSARITPLAADRVSRDVGEVTRTAPADVVIRARELDPAGLGLELWCADEGWCETAAARLGGDHQSGFVWLVVRRGGLRLA
jgi:RNA 3'-terminal phosphate cyclase